MSADCPARAKLTDVLELLAHDDGECDVCSKPTAAAAAAAAPAKKTPTPPTPPPIRAAAAVTPATTPVSFTASSAASAPQTQPRNPRKRTNNNEARKEAKPLPTGMAIKRLCDEKGFSKGRAAVEIVETRRKNVPKVLNDKVDRKLMPFVPPVIYLPLTADNKVPTSCLSADAHRRYVAIITNFLKSEQTLRFEQNKLELKGYDEILVEERRYYEAECLKKIENWQHSPYTFITKNAKAAYLKKLRNRLKDWPKEGGGFQQVLKTFDWPINDSNATGTQCRPVIASTLNAGRTPRIQMPEPRRRCVIPMSANVIDNESTSCSMPIESDQDAVRVMMQNEVKVLIDACTLRSLLVMPWTQRDQKFAVRVTVRQALHDNRFRRYLVFSKPILVSQLSQPSLQWQATKWMLRAAITRREPQTKGAAAVKRKAAAAAATAAAAAAAAASSVAEPLPPPMPPSLPPPSTPPSLAQLSAEESDLSIEEEPTLSIDEEVPTPSIDEKAPSIEEEAPMPSIVEPTDGDMLGDILKRMGCKPIKKSQPAASVPQTTRPLDDLLGGILKNMGGETKESEKMELEFDANSLAGAPHRYSLFEIESNVAPKQRLLVLASNHGIDQNGERLSYTVKLDYLPAIGGERMSEEEQLWSFFTALFKQSLSHATMRIHPQNGNVLQIERRLTKLAYSTLSEEIRAIISQRCERLCGLLNYMGELEPGEYLLKPNNETLDVLSPTIENPDEIVYNADHFISCAQEEFVPPAAPSAVWQGVDVHVPLAWHVVMGRAPGALLPPKSQPPPPQ